MDIRYKMLDLHYVFGEADQHLFPTVLFGKGEVVLVDCGYPGSLVLLEEQLFAHDIHPDSLTKLVLTHQDDDHMGAAAELKERYPDIQIAASQIEAPYLSGQLKNLRLQQGEEFQSRLPDDQKAFGEQFCNRFRALRPVPVDLLLSPGDRFDWGGGCEIIASPGHTPGHISIRALDNEFMITGDAAVVEDRELAVANPEYCLNLALAQNSLDRIVQYHCRHYVCYHGGLLEP